MLSNEVKQYLVKVCAILHAHDVDYLVVGGAAVNHYGFSRPSGIGQYHSGLKVDLDFWYNPTIDNYQNIVSALDDLEVDTVDLKNLVFDKKRTFLKIPHKEFHTDFLPVMEGLDPFKVCKERAEKAEIEGLSVPILSYEDLILNKRALNRKTDQSDIEGLDRARSKRRGRRI